MTPPRLTQIVLAAGLSSRYGRLKQLDPVGPSGEAVLDYTLLQAREAGFDDLALVIRPVLRDAFDRHFERYRDPPAVRYVHQRGRGGAGGPKPWGTGEAVLRAGDRPLGPFAVCNADDLYGAAAHGALAEALRDAGPAGRSPVPAWMVAYRLDRTLSSHGGVSRGICAVESDGSVTGVREVLEIQRGLGGLAGVDPGGRAVALDGSEPVSMNLWGFGPAILPLLEASFERFRRAAGPTEEFALSTAVDALVQEGAVHLTAIDTTAPWAGVTWPSDREVLTRWIAERVERGDLPSSVFDP